MISVDVSADFSAARRRLEVKQKAVDQAAARSLNRAIVTVRAEAVKRLQPEYPGLKAAYLRARMKLQNARRTDLKAVVVFSGKRVSLYGNFSMRRTGAFGVRFTKLPWRVEDLQGDAVSPEMLGRAFRNRLRGGGRATVFARYGKRRLPIAILVAPGIAKAVVDAKIKEALKAVGGRRFKEVFAQELRFAALKG